MSAVSGSEPEHVVVAPGVQAAACRSQAPSPHAVGCRLGRALRRRRRGGIRRHLRAPPAGGARRLHGCPRRSSRRRGRHAGDLLGARSGAADPPAGGAAAVADPRRPQRLDRHDPAPAPPAADDRRGDPRGCGPPGIVGQGRACRCARRHPRTSRGTAHGAADARARRPLVLGDRRVPGHRRGGGQGTDRARPRRSAQLPRGHRAVMLRRPARRSRPSPTDAATTRRSVAICAPAAHAAPTARHCATTPRRCARRFRSRLERLPQAASQGAC